VTQPHRCPSLKNTRVLGGNAHHQSPGGGAVRMPGATPAALPTRRLYTRNLDDFHGLDGLAAAVAV
jgi:hypothetical protein